MAEMDKNGSPNGVNAKINHFLKHRVKNIVVDNKYIFIGLLICLILIFMGNIFVLSPANIELNKNKDVLYNIQSENNRIQESMKQIKEVYKDIDTDLNDTRHRDDDKYMYSFLRDMYTYTGLDEYNTTRNKYLNYFGKDNEYINRFMPVRNDFGDVYIQNVYQGDAFDCVKADMKSFKSYVLSVNDDKVSYLVQTHIQEYVYDMSKSISGRYYAIEYDIFYYYTTNSPSGSGDNYKVSFDNFKMAKSERGFVK